MLSTLANNLRKRVTQALPGKRPSYRIFNVQLKRRIALSPSLTRLVFTGPEVAEMTTLAPDQRVKLLFPAPDGSPPSLNNDLHWKAAHSALPPTQRPPMRTYTIRALRREALEVDIDFVLHGVNGPASAWATHAQVGDRLQIVAPNLAYDGDPGGYEWKPPQGVRNVLLVGDETALPAIAGILEQLADTQPEPGGASIHRGAAGGGLPEPAPWRCHGAALAAARTAELRTWPSHAARRARAWPACRLGTPHHGRSWKTWILRLASCGNRPVATAASFTPGWRGIGDGDGDTPVPDQGTWIAARMPDVDGVLAGRPNL